MMKDEAMATVREGNQVALIVVDVQIGVMADAWDAARVVGNVARAVERARERQVPVIWVQHSDADLMHGSAPWQLVPELTPEAGEPVIDKHFESSFEQTSLEDELSRIGATHLTLAGAATNWCIRATAYAALDRGYDLTLIKDAHTTKTIELDSGKQIAASDIVEELNIAMTWLSYPGRVNGTASVEAIDFTPPGAR